MANNNDKKVLNVPALRFPEFADKWEKGYFKDVCKITTGNKNTQDKDENGLYPFYVRSQNIERINTWTFDGEAILTAGDGVGVGKVFHYSIGKIGVHQRVYILSNFKCDGKYLYQYFSSRFYNRVKRMSAKNSVDSVRMEMIADMPLYLPSVGEQHKIGKLLALLDERISTQNKIIEDLKKLKSAIIDKLYSSTNGEIDSFRQLFEVVNEKNKARAYKNILSASQELGMIERSDINIDIKFEQESISGYKIVHKGDYVVHLRSFQGGFAFSDRTGICSPAYIILRPNDLVVYGYLSHFFTSKPFIKSLKLVTYGIRDGRSINVNEWLDMPILLPPAQEQIRILTIVNAIDAKLHNEVKVQFCLSSQKSYLLDTMFI